MRHDGLLSGPQRLRLSVLAAGIEDSVGEIQRLLDPDLDGTLTRYADDLPMASAERLRPLLIGIRAQLARMTSVLALEPQSFSRLASVQAQVSAQIVCIDESGVKELRGYGSVAPALGAELGPILRDLRATFREIEAQLRSGG
jgi:hypothetical protein